MLEVYPLLFSFLPSWVGTVLLILVTTALLVLLIRVIIAVVSAIPFF